MALSNALPSKGLQFKSPNFIPANKSKIKMKKTDSTYDFDFSTNESSGRTQLKYTYIPTLEILNSFNMLNTAVASSKEKIVFNYLTKCAEDLLYIELCKDKMAGIPVVKDRRLPISTLIANIYDFLEENQINEICNDYEVTPSILTDTINYTIKVLNGLQSE